MTATASTHPRLWVLVALSLSGFVMSFGGHVVATNLPADAETVGAAH
jgi:hypothetical protein